MPGSAPRILANPGAPTSCLPTMAAGGGSTVSGRASPRSTPATSHLTPAEQLMNQRLHEFGDSRGIMAGGTQ